MATMLVAEKAAHWVALRAMLKADETAAMWAETTVGAWVVCWVVRRALGWAE
jgi:hypothetical protein